MSQKVHIKLCLRYDIKRWYIYVHKINSGIPFYVGKGTGTRAFQIKGRNKQHKSIQDKHGCNIEIIYYSYNENEAYKKEQEFIVFYHTWMRDPNISKT